jgi:hypothetical protein
MSFGGWNARASRGPWDVADARKQHNKWLADFERTLTHVGREIGNTAVSLAEDQKVIKNRTGQLRLGWKKALSGDRRKITITLFSKVPHALYHEKGTGIYGPKGRPITPKRAKFLRWVDVNTGKVMYRRSVKGVPPKWIGKRSTFNAFQIGKRMFRRELSATASRF